MLDAYIIDEIMRKEQEKQERERPRLYIRIDDKPTKRDKSKERDISEERDYKIDIPLDTPGNDEDDGKIVINMFNSYKI